MEDYKIIEMWYRGYSIKYITNEFYKKENKENKPMYINGRLLLPKTYLSKDYCRRYVYGVLYNYMYCNKT